VSLSKGERTRQKLVSATGALLRRRGYHGVGLGQILSESGAPRGSLYFHFPGGKQELAAAAIECEGALWRERVAAVVASAPDLAAAVIAVGDLLAADLEQSDFTDGCPAATVALEIASESEVLRARCAALYDGWEQLITDVMADAGLPTTHAGTLARFALCAFEGAMLMAKVRRSGAPIREVARAIALQVSALYSER